MPKMEREIEGTEIATSMMGRWAPSDLAYIERLEFRADAGEIASVTMVGLFQRRDTNTWPSIDGAMRRVRLFFEEVHNPHLKGFGSGHVQIMGFDIRPIADRGWENAFFEIEDYEEGRLGFTCARIRVIEIEEEEVYLP